MYADSLFTTANVLFALTLIELLLLLLVLFARGRDRVYPWFTASVALVTARAVLMALREELTKLLHGHLATPMEAFYILLGDLAALVGLLVAVEMARRAFAGAKRLTWILGTVALLAVCAAGMTFGKSWPSLDTFSTDSPVEAMLRLGELAAQKGGVLVNLLTLELGVLVFLFGRRYKAGWHSHTQRIMIGLSTMALGQLTALGVWQAIAVRAEPQNLPDYVRIQNLGARLVDANKVVYLAVLAWWIVCLWKNQGKRIRKARRAPEMP